jgi:hypothetical protein
VDATMVKVIHHYVEMLDFTLEESFLLFGDWETWACPSEAICAGGVLFANNPIRFESCGKS